MQELQVSIDFQARYFKLGDITPATKGVWFVLHGYGQLAKYFIAKFASLPEHNICVIAPEGLSHFYLEDVNTRSKTGSTRVGATWMTRENRLMEIQNYLTYLNMVYQTELSVFPSIPVTMLGFSQGAATASRWIEDKPDAFKKFILWSGIFPNDMDFEKGKAIFSKVPATIVYGKNDPFLTESRIGEMNMLSEKLGVTSTPVVFDGGHEIHEPTLLGLL